MMTSCGFDSLATQATTRRVLQGIAFNLLVVGQVGIGKTTLINSLFNINYNDPPDLDRNAKEVELRIEEFSPQNRTIEIKFTIIETKRFEQSENYESQYKPIVEYIEARYDEHMLGESISHETKYNDIADSRVHCCIYMISPMGLKPIDIITMKQLHQRVCLIPVIGRSEAFTENERRSKKREIIDQLNRNEIKIYSPTDCDLPFAVAASDEVIVENGTRLRVRSLPRHRIYIDRDSEFPALRDLLLRSNMLDLIETTDRVHYEKFRKGAIEEYRDFYKFKQRYENEKKALLEELERSKLK